MRRLQQTKTMPPLIAAQGSTNQSFVIPISLSGKTICNMNKKFQPVVVRTSSTKSLLTSSTIKTTTVPILSTAPRPPSMLQAQQPQIVTVSGKTMIRTAVSNAPVGTTSMQLIQAKPVQHQPQQPHQQKIIVAGANALGNAGNKVSLIYFKYFDSDRNCAKYEAKELISKKNKKKIQEQTCNLFFFK